MENVAMNKLAQDVQELVNLGKPGTVIPPAASNENEAPAFSSLVKQALDTVNSQQKAAADFATDIETGKSKDLLGAMLAGQKASLSFQALVQIRNKAVAAYEEIMRMQV